MAALNTASRPWNKPKTVAPAPKSTLAPADDQKKRIGTLNVATGEYTPINNPIDRLATLREQIAKLTKEEKELTEAVRKLGDGEHDGDKVKAVVSTTHPERLDTTAIKAAMPDEWVKRFTKSSPQTTVRFKPLV